MNARINVELPFADNSFHRLLYFAEATSARRITRLAGAESVTNEPGHFVRNGRAASSRYLIANMVLVEAKAVAQWNRIVLDLNSNTYAQILNGKVFAAFIFQIDD
jgi:hypothetical protein